MRNLIFILFIIVFSCDKNNEDSFDLSCTEENCEFMNPFDFSLTPHNEAIEIVFGQYSIYEGIGKVCLPDAIEFYISENNQDYDKIATVDPLSEFFIIEELQNGTEYFIRMVNVHCTLDPIALPILSVIAGEIALPDFIDNSGNGYKGLRLSPSGNQFVYAADNDWYLSTLNNTQARTKIIEDASNVQWSPFSDSEISYVQETRIDILPNLQGITSESLVTLDLSNDSEAVLHKIDQLHDFTHDVHNPEQYWIHEFHYSLDGNSIYLTTNKDNGSSNNYEKEVFNNIWNLDLNTGTLVTITDFLPVGFKMKDFIEDPRQHGNFYLLGSDSGSSETLNNPDGINIHYFDSFDASITPVFTSDYSKGNISIDPLGDNIVFASHRTGKGELWSLNLAGNRMAQLSNSSAYNSVDRWRDVSWISDTKFMTYVKHDNGYKFATFTVK